MDSRQKDAFEVLMQTCINAMGKGKRFIGLVEGPPGTLISFVILITIES